MILQGKEIEQKKLVQNTKWEGQFQPAGVDLSLESVWEFESAGAIDGDNSRRELPKSKQLAWGGQNFIHLLPGSYKIIFNEAVSIPKDCAAMARSRSTLLRCGACVQTALWDPGYVGRSEALLVVKNNHGLKVFRDAKVAQLVFIRLSNAVNEGYKGKYQGENL